MIAKGISPLDELELKYNPTEDFEDTEELKLILGNILTYPSTELAELHRQADRLGDIDLKNDSEDEF